MKNLLLPLALGALGALPSGASASPFTAAPAQTGAPVGLVQAEAAEPGGTPRRAAPRPYRPTLKTGIDDLRVEASAYADAPEADAGLMLRASPYVLWQPVRAWEFRAGVQLTGAAQRGGASPFDRWRADLADTYARYRSGDTRLTLGAQTIVWGRVDGMPVIDRVGRADLSRFVLDNLPDRRRPQWALRWEQTLGDYKLDGVVLPAFRGAHLPALGSVWSPINRLNGEVIGLAPSAALAALATTATVRQDHGDGGGAALRLTRTGVAPADFGLTLARTRQSLPYYRADATGPSLTAAHPYVSFAGIDAEFVTGALTWRSELGFTRDQPVTLASGVMARSGALDWIGAVEFFPGGGETRVNLQLAARRLRTDQTVLELKEYYGVNGEIETAFGQGRWKLALRFFSGLNLHDTYLAPKLSFLGWEPHEVYLVLHHFDGASRTLGGFHRDHRTVALGLKTRF